MFSIGFLGFGNMAKAIYRGIKTNFPNQTIHVYDVNIAQFDEKENYYICNSIKELCIAADIIFLCVKPNIIPEVCREISIDNKAFVSIAAGVTQSYLSQILPSNSRLVRIMPNTPLTVNEGMVCLQIPNTLNKVEEDYIIKLFSRMGEIIKINGDLMDVVTGISGSGPAYVYLFIDAMSKAGQENGLSKSDSIMLTLQTFIGACAMVRETQKEPTQLIKEVCSPNGTTLAAMEILNANNVKDVIVNAVDAAIKRSEDISKSL